MRKKNKSKMKYILLIAVILVTLSSTFSQRGIGTNAPDASAAFDVSSTNKGVLIPRVALLGNNDVTTIASPQTSLIVYNTSTAIGINAIVPGFYYFNGTQWDLLVNQLQSTIPQEISDEDLDTKIQVEENNDEDIIRFDNKGVENMTLDTLGDLNIVNGWVRANFSNLEEGTISGNTLYKSIDFTNALSPTSSTEIVFPLDTIISNNGDKGYVIKITYYHFARFGFLGTLLSSDQVIYNLSANGNVTPPSSYTTNTRIVRNETGLNFPDITYDLVGNEAIIKLWSPTAISTRTSVAVMEISKRRVTPTNYANNDLTFWTNSIFSRTITETIPLADSLIYYIKELNVINEYDSHTQANSILPNQAKYYLTGDPTEYVKRAGTTQPQLQNGMSDNDNDTKIQVEESNDEDIIRFDTKGVERMIIDSNGTVRIRTPFVNNPLFIGDTSGVNSDAGALYLDYNSPSTALNLVEYDDPVLIRGIQKLSGNSAFISMFEGNTGIGITAPNAKLHIMDTSGPGVLKIEGTQSGFTNATVNLHATDNTNQRGLGTIMIDDNGSNSWFSGRPYAGGFGNNDFFVVNRHATATSSVVSAVQDGGSLPTATRNFFAIRNNGNVGIDTILPEAKLHVYEDRDITSAPNAKGIRLTESIGDWLLSLGVENVTNTGFAIRDIVRDEYPFVIRETTGNIGIGTVSPARKLEVAGDVNVGLNTTPLVVNSYGNRLYFGGNAQNSDDLWMARYNTIADRSFLRMYIGDNTSQDDAFQIGSGPGFAAPLMHVNNGGRVGLGTATPSGKLTINETDQAIHIAQTTFNYNGTTPIGMQLGAWGVGYTNAAGIKLNRWSGGAPHYSAYVGQSLDPVSSTYGLDFRVDEFLAQGDATTSRMYIRTDGNVGIGTTSPSEKLEITGGGIQLNDTNGIGFRGERPFNANALNDGAKFYYEQSVFGLNLDALIIEKTDYNNADPDGGIVFANKGSDNVREIDMVIRGSGNVGVGTITPTERLEVVGNILASGTITPSDERYKTNIATLNNSLSKLMKLRGVSYTMKKEFVDKGFGEGIQIGVIAQEIEKLYPEIVITNKETGYKGVDYSKLTPILIEATKEQQKTIEFQEKKIQKLENEDLLKQKRLNKLEKELEEIKALILKK
jgi:hypothetical protein